MTDNNDAGLMSKPSLTRLVQGAVAGGLLLAVVGFGGLDWKLGTQAEQMSQDARRAGMTDVLAVLCVDRYKTAAEADNDVFKSLVAAQYQDRRDLILKAGWAVFPHKDVGEQLIATQCTDGVNRLMARL